MSNALKPGPLKPTLWDVLKSLPGWQMFLCLLPLALMFVGGVVGGAAGGAAMYANTRTARTGLAGPYKAMAMLGTALLAAAATFAVAFLIAYLRYAG